MSLKLQHKKLVIGLFGFGVVGEGVYEVLSRTPGLNAVIKKICIRHPEKERNAPAELFTTDRDLLLYDDEINVIVELTSDADAAFHIVSTALKNKKAVVSANKKMIARQLETLIGLQHRHGTPLLYESAVCASIPVIRNLEEYYDNDLLCGFSGIVNGSTNYILSRLSEGLDFGTALRQAQAAGFAEADPSLDVEGIDAVNKLAILLAHAYGLVISPDSLICSGIGQLRKTDAEYAREKGYRIRLTAEATRMQDGSVAAFVLPRFVRPENQLFHVCDEYNGLVIESSLADKQFFYGKGAGSFPTASAVLSDLSALRYDYRYEYKKRVYQVPSVPANGFFLNVYASFDGLLQVPHRAFEAIHEWNSGADRCYVTGIVHSSSLLENDWWKKPGVSVIVLPEAFAAPADRKTSSDVFAALAY